MTFIFLTDKPSLFVVGEGANIEEAKANAKASLDKLGNGARLTTHQEITYSIEVGPDATNPQPF